MSNYTAKKKRKKPRLPATFDVRFLELADQRTSAMRLVRERFETLSQHAGVDSLQKELLCRRATFLSLQLESIEVRAIEGDEAVDLGKYSVMLNTFLGVLKALGLDKQIPKSLDSLQNYVAKKERER